MGERGLINCLLQSGRIKKKILEHGSTRGALKRKDGTASQQKMNKRKMLR